MMWNFLERLIDRWLPFFKPFLFFFKRYFFQLILTAITIIFLLTYFESLRWPLPGPKATHGIAKGLALLLFGSLVFFKKEQLAKLKSTPNVLMFVFFVSYLVSAAFSLDMDTSILHLWYPFMATLVFSLLSILPIKKGYFSILAGFSVMLVFITFAFAFFSIVFRYSVDNIYYFIFLEHRANYFLEEIRQFGKYVSLGPYLMLSPMVVAFLVEKKANLVRKALAFFTIMIALLTAMISNNRIDALVMAIHSGFYALSLSRRQIVMLVLPVIAMITIGLTITETYFGFNLEERILRPEVERDQETVSMRYTYWDTALENFRNYPLFGTGPNTYNTVSSFPLRRYFDRGAYDYTIRPDEGIGVHNLFFERLADTGLFGFFSFVALLVFFARQDFLFLARLYHREDKESFKKYLLYSLGSWSWILYGITDNGYGAQGFMVFFFLRGLLPHAYRLELSSNKLSHAKT